MSDAAELAPSADAESIARWAETVGVRIELDRLPAVQAYLAEIRVAIEALEQLDLSGADLAAPFDPSWDGPVR